MTLFDHIVFPVTDLGSAAAWLETELGLVSVAGGRHPGHGTANLICPLGLEYLELVTVDDVDAAVDSPWGRWVSANATARPRPVAWCLRTDDIDTTAHRIGCEVVSMERHRPDGELLSWRLTGLEGALSTEQLPFFITWDVDPSLLPAATPVGHHRQPLGVDWIEVGRVDGFDTWISSHELDVRVVDALAGIRRLGIRMVDGVSIV